MGGTLKVFNRHLGGKNFSLQTKKISNNIQNQNYSIQKRHQGILVTRNLPGKNREW